MVIPGVNIGTVSADQVNSHVVKDTIKAANKINRDYLTVLEAAAEAAEATYSASDVYGSLLKLRAEYITENKGEYEVPTACFVSPAVYSELIKNKLISFKENEPTGNFLGFAVIEAPDLVANAVMLNAEAMISGIAFTDTTVFDAAPLGYAGGTAYIGELAYVNKATEHSADFAGKPILKF